MTDRGVSVTVNYVLTLGITTLLITGLLIAVGGLMDDRRESATRGELRVIGERVTSDLMTADRLAQIGASEVVVRPKVPGQVAGKQYTLMLNATDRQIILETSDPDVVVRVPFQNTTAVASSSTEGGNIQIVLADPGGADEALEVRSA